jgi:hypothetical protein
MGAAGPGADWRDADAYALLLRADRSIFAWEWLRRDPCYRAAAEQALEGGAASVREAAAWGLLRFEDPGLAAPDARPLWRAEDHRLVLRARAVRPREPRDTVDLASLCGLSTMIEQPAGGEHWLLSDGLSAIRLDLVEGTCRCGPVELQYLLFGRASLRGPLLSLRRLLGLIEARRFGKALHPAEPGARRWILRLRAHDALACGASQREIAAAMLSASAGTARWRVHEASLRSQVQRLVRSARWQARRGWRAFL